MAEGRNGPAVVAFFEDALIPEGLEIAGHDGGVAVHGFSELCEGSGGFEGGEPFALFGREAELWEWLHVLPVRLQRSQF